MRGGMCTPDAITAMAYDSANRLTGIADPEGNITRYEYATAGCPTCGGSADTPAKITDPLGKVTQNGFDKAGRVVGITDPLSNLTQIVRDAAGRASSTTDANGNTTSRAYDGLGRVVGQTDANGGETDFGYDGYGNLSSLSDPNGNRTGFEYDLAGRKTRETRPMGQATAYTYYPNGLLSTVKDAKGPLTSYAYDAGSRLTGVTYVDGKKDIFGYDAAGNLTSYAKDGVSGTIVYDELNRKTSETVNFGVFSKRFSYSYDARGNKQSFTAPDGTVYTYGYNKDDQPTSITFDGRQVSFAYEGGRLSRTTFPKGLVTSYGYNDASWLSGITTTGAIGTVEDNQYGFDKVGNITSKTANQGSHSYGYDPTYQVTSATHPALPSESFSYDQTGNRIASTGGGQSATYAHDANNEMASAGSATFGYDANGNLVTKTDGDGTTTFVYNSADRLEKVLLPDGSSATYTYDPFGRRVKKDVAGEVTYYLYSDEGLIGEYDASGSLEKGYGWKPNGIWGTDPVFMTEGGSYYFYRNDHLGTPQKLIDENGNVVWSAEYTAFGEAIVDPASTVENNLRFPGQYFDEETNLHYNLSRYYDPETGRYTQIDPIGFAAGDINLYRYTANNPVLYKDPQGRFVPLVTGLIGGVAGGLGNLAWQAYDQGFDNVNWKNVGIAFGTGFVAGALAPLLPATLPSAMIQGALANVGQYWLTQRANCQDVKGADLLANAVTGALGGFVAGPMSKATLRYAEESLWMAASEAKAMNAIKDISLNLTTVNIIRNLGAGLTSNFDLTTKLRLTHVF